MFLCLEEGGYQYVGCWLCAMLVSDSIEYDRRIS